MAPRPAAKVGAGDEAVLCPVGGLVVELRVAVGAGLGRILGWYYRSSIL